MEAVFRIVQIDDVNYAFERKVAGRWSRFTVMIDWCKPIDFAKTVLKSHIAGCRNSNLLPREVARFNKDGEEIE